MSRRTLILLAILALAVGVLTPVAAGAAAPDKAPVKNDKGIAAVKDAPLGVFIVQMTQAPAVAMDGEGKAKKVNPNSAAARKYRDELERNQDAAAKSVGADAFYNYTVSFNGFAAVMTGADAATLATRDDVAYVWMDEIRYPVTDNSPGFLELTANGGLWDSGYTGEDVIVGVIDTGIWPEHPSFSDQVDLTDQPGKSGKRSLAYGAAPADWYGTCQSGEQFSQDDCNNKLIGAQYFKDGFTNNGIKISGDYLSARDADGHGSHTASTAAGNAEVSASLLGIDRGVVSGIAPRARIAAYKVCWADAGCAGSDLVAAIDQAVADNVDVINYSIGGGSTSFLTADSVAFLFAEDAGVHIATSAGNSGPGSSTIGNPAVAPWVTTVGASTQDRTFQGSATLNDAGSSVFYGASVTGDTSMLPLVDSVDASSELCYPGELDPGVVAGNIVLCKRGAIARVDKSKAVMMAGGAGMILYNADDTQSQVTDNHFVPSVHINNTDGLAVKAHIVALGAEAEASITGGVFTVIPAPWMASFSSRGPNGGSADLIKPDVTAPGVNILAANTPTPFSGAPDQLFQAISGTSMSSPHVAGVLALLKDARPDWTPAMAKSALMTTGYQDVWKENGSTPADPFDMGAGHINPNPAVDPGLVYEAGFLDYLAFLCGSTSGVSQDTCDFLALEGYSFDASDLNLASIGVGELTGQQTITRTVTNVGPAGTYTVSHLAPSGVDVEVVPATLDLGVGESAPYEVTFTANESADYNEWVFGSLTWSHGPHSVRSPIAVRPVELAAPAEVEGAGVEGTASFDVAFGYNGGYSAAGHGLEPATVDSGNVLQDPDQTFDKDDGYSDRYDITLSGAAALRVAIPPDAVGDPDIDLDVLVYGPDDKLAGSSTSGGTDEVVTIALPADGTWSVYVHGWYTAGPSADYDLYSWVISATPGGSLTVESAPTSASIGAVGTVDVSWTAATAGEWHLGAVSHTGTSGLAGLTLVDVDNR